MGLTFVGAVSSSTIVTVAVPGLPMAEPGDGFESVTVKVWLPSTKASLVSSTVTVFGEESPAAHWSVPESKVYLFL